MRLIFRIFRLFFTTSSKKYPLNPARDENVTGGVIPLLPKAQVLWVVDGDTVIVSKGWWYKVTVRLDAIDCPEDGQYWGDIAKYGLMKMIGRKHIRMEEHGLDFHGRTLATIYVWNSQKNEWMNVNERMVTLGHAWVMRRYYSHLSKERQDKLNGLERWAKTKRIGLWHAANPVPPWEWRNAKRSSDGISFEL